MLRPMTTDLPIGGPVEGEPAGRPGRRVLQGRYVRLEPADPAHADALWRAANDGGDEAVRMWTYMPYGPFADAGEMRAWISSVAASEDPLFLAVVGERGPIGMVSFLNLDVTMRRIELGHIWYAPSAQRSEANTEATSLMLAEAFDELGYRRVEWKCDALNERSRAAAVRLGFTFEGVFRQHMIVKGRNRDTAWYSMLDGEWPRTRAAFRRWLAADPWERPSLASLRAPAS
jgi:RimJ/RimL family protein N-acetyltransferase